MGVFKKSIALSRKFMTSVETSNIPFVYFLLTFFFIINLRTFLEVFSDDIEISLNYILHYNLFYVAVVLSFLLLFYVLTKIKIIKLAKLMLPSLAVLFIAPIFDLAVTLGKGYNMSYLLPGTHGNLILRFFTFFGDFPGIGITPGIRIGVALGVIGSFFYVYLKKSKILKSLFCAICTYILIFLFAMTPYIIKFLLELFGIQYKWSDLLFSYFFLTLILIFGLILAYLGNKRYFKIFINDIRMMIMRILSLVLLFFFGVILGLSKSSFTLGNTNIFSFLFIPLSIVFAVMFLIVINNLADYDIDKISNKNRPLVKSKINPEAYKKFAWPFLFLSLAFALIINFKVFYLVLLFIGGFFLYSAPPLRLKRVPILAKLIIAASSLLLVLSGYVLITGAVSGFPGIIVAIFLIGAALVANLIDIKDYEGDKQAGIKTLPVLLGLKKSKILIGVFMLLTYVSICFLSENLFVQILFILLGILQYYLINKKTYNEKLIFLVFLLTIVILLIHLF